MRERMNTRLMNIGVGRAMLARRGLKSVLMIERYIGGFDCELRARKTRRALLRCRL